MNKVTNIEKESVIIFNEAERMALIDTYNPKWQSQLAEAAELYPDECQLKREHEMGNKAYLLPKSWLKLKLPMKLTAEQKAERAARLQKKPESQTM